MKERDLLNWIISVALWNDWKIYHVPAPMVANRKGGFVGSPRAKGLPDLFLLHEDPPRLIVAELKGDGGKLTDEQRECLTLFRNVAEASLTNIVTDYDRNIDGDRPMAVYAWTPADQPIIERILKGKMLL